MWAMSIISVLFAVLLMLMPGQGGNVNPRGDQQNDAIAKNFIIYRNSINQYALDNPSVVGTIPQSSLDFGPWQISTDWTNVVTATDVYVYGNLSPAVGNEVLRQTEYSLAYGWNQSGNLVSPVEGNLGALPSTIPEGAFVSFIEK